MVTLFTVPKPFIGETIRPQANAIRSWLAQRDVCRIMVFVAENTIFNDESELMLRKSEINALDIITINDVNEHGTPYLDTVFKTAAERSSSLYLMYINADIILPSINMRMLFKGRCRRKLYVGSRWNLDYHKCIRYESVTMDAEAAAAEALRANSKNYPHGSDYFVMPKMLTTNMPRFLVGRPNWDVWLMAYAHQLRYKIYDCTHAITAVHQNHDYDHVKNRTGAQWEGPEADYNTQCAGGVLDVTLVDAHYVYSKSRFRVNNTWKMFNRRIHRMSSLTKESAARPASGILLAFVRWVRRTPIKETWIVRYIIYHMTGLMRMDYMTPS